LIDEMVDEMVDMIEREKEKLREKERERRNLSFYLISYLKIDFLSFILIYYNILKNVILLNKMISSFI